jgi:hypothetical protein
VAGAGLLPVVGVACDRWSWWHPHHNVSVKRQPCVSARQLDEVMQLKGIKLQGSVKILVELVRV